MDNLGLLCYYYAPYYYVATAGGVVRRAAVSDGKEGRVQVFAAVAFVVHSVPDTGYYLAAPKAALIGKARHAPFLFLKTQHATVCDIR
jgi:hypothetical protein